MRPTYLWIMSFNSLRGTQARWMKLEPLPLVGVQGQDKALLKGIEGSHQGQIRSGKAAKSWRGPLKGKEAVQTTCCRLLTSKITTMNNTSRPLPREAWRTKMSTSLLSLWTMRAELLGAWVDRAQMGLASSWCAEIYRWSRERHLTRGVQGCKAEVSLRRGLLCMMTTGKKAGD